MSGTRLGVLFFALVFCLHAGARAQCTARLERTPPERPSSALYERDIVVRFKDEMGRRVEVDVQRALRPSAYDLRADCDPEQPVTIERVVWLGVGDKEGTTTGVVLYGDFRDECTYTLRVFLPSVSAAAIEVEPLAAPREPGFGFRRIAGFFDRYTTGTLDARTLEGEGARVGFDFRLRMDFPVVHDALGADALRCRFAAAGTISMYKSGMHPHNAVSAQFSFSWLKYYLLPGLGKNNSGVHALGLRLAPLGVETDRNMDKVDLTLGPSVVFSVPYAHWPLLAWASVAGIERGILPFTVEVSYKYVRRVRKGGMRSVPDRRRLDVEAVGRLPLLRRLDLLVRLKAYYDVGRSARHELLDLTWRWYLDESGKAAMIVKALHGALPPEFGDAETVGLGFAVGL